MDEETAKAVSALGFKNADEEEMTYMESHFLDGGRRQVMSAAFPEVASAARVVAATARKGDDVREFTVAFKGDGPAEPQMVMGSCQIMFEDLTPSECIEYCFAEEPNAWCMAQLSQEALESYRGMKFKAWQEMLVNPTCEAQFRRMLQIGLICELFDPQVFPTPEAHKPKYQVTDDRTGKLIQLPHPVSGLRVWDAVAQSYKAVETRLTSAPGAADAEKWWGDFVQELNGKHGAEYIAGLVAGK